MKNLLHKPSSRRLQCGVSIIAAIFLLLLFSALAALIANFRNVSELTSAEDVLGIRAHFAARAVVEYGVYYAMAPNNDPPTAGNCPPPMPALPAFPGYVVSVECAFADHVDGPRSVRIYRIKGRARVAGPLGNVEREMEATVENCRNTADGSRC